MRRHLHPSQKSLVKLGKHSYGIVRNCTFSYRLKGDIDPTVLYRIYEDALSKFDALSLVLIEDGANCLYWEYCPQCRVVVEIREASEQEQFDLVSVAQSEIFDLSSGPIGRILLLRTGCQEWTVSEVFSHAVADAPSLSLLHEAVRLLYENRVADPFGSYLAALGPVSNVMEIGHQLEKGSHEVVSEELDESNAKAQRDTCNEYSVLRTLSPELQDVVKSTARSLGVTPAAIFLSAFSQALCRARGVSQTGVLIAVDTRGADDTRTFGQFARLIPVSPFPGWKETLAHGAVCAAECIYDAIENALISDEEFGLRGLSTSLFEPDQAVFVFQNGVLLPPKFGDCQTSLFHTKDLPGAGGINCFVREVSTGGISYEIRTSEEGSFRELAEMVAEMVLNHLTLLSIAPNVLLSSDDLLPTQDRLVTSEAQEGLAPYPYIPSERLALSQLKLKRRYGCLKVGNTVFTGGQLRERVAYYLRMLTRLRVSEGDLIAVGEDKTFDRISAYLAVLRSGGTYLPFDGNFGGVNFDSSEVTVLIEDGIVGRLRPKHSGKFPDTAYIIFTSGSTGRPKGVLINRRALSNLIQGERDRFGLGPQSRVLLIAPPIVDPWICHVSASLAHGATIVAEDVMGKRSLSELIESEEISHAFLPAALVAHVEDRAFPKLKILASAGDHCRRSDAVRFKNRHFGFYNIYGPTEATVTATTHKVVRSATPYVSIGRPIAGVEAAVLIDGEARAPLNVVGELYLLGIQLSDGYLGNPAETSNKFSQLGFGLNKRAYRTGDLACVDQYGEIVLKGRQDRQAKVRGFRIEPEAIEAAARDTGLCSDAYAKIISREGQGDINKSLILFVSGCVNQEGLMQNLLKSTSPSHRPHAIQVVETLPRNSAGKIVEDELVYEEPEPSLPRALDADEQIIAGIWRDVLGATPKPDTSFFQLGGDSLSVLKVVRKLRLLGYEVAPRDVYKHPTLMGLAELLSLSKRMTIGMRPLRKEEKLGPMEAWFWKQGFLKPSIFSQTHVIYSQTRVPLQIAQRAYDQIVRSEPAFHFKYHADHRHKSLLSEIELQSKFIAVDDDDPASLSRAFERVNSWIDPTEGKLLGAIAVNTSFGSCLVLIAHHLAVDDWSWMVIEDRFINFLQNRPLSTDWAEPSSAIVPNAYDDALALGAFSREAAMWIRILQSGKTSITGRYLGDLRQVARQIRLPEVPKGKVRHLSAGLVLAALSASLYLLEGEGASVVDIERNARIAFDDIDTSRAVGWFASHHPVLLKHCSLDDWEGAVLDITLQLEEVPSAGVSYVVSRWVGSTSSYGAEVGRFSLNITEEALGEHCPLLTKHIYEAKKSCTDRSNRLAYDASISIRLGETGATIEFEYDLLRIPDRAATALTEQIASLIESYLRSPLPPMVLNHTSWYDFPKADLVPATFMQKLMIQETLRWEGGTYIPSQIIKLSDPRAEIINANRCLTLFRAIDAFRMRFMLVDSQLFVRWDDIPAGAIMDSEGGLDQAIAFIAKEKTTGFPNLCNGEVPFKVRIFKENSHTLYIAMLCHHAILDGVSNERLLSLLMSQDGEVRRIRGGGREGFLRQLSLEEQRSTTHNIIKLAQPSRRTWVKKYIPVDQDLLKSAEDWCARHHTDLKALVGGTLLVWMSRQAPASKLLVVTNGRDGVVPGMEDAIGMFWYFRRVAPASQDVLREAKQIMDVTSGSVGETQSAILDRGLETNSDFISFNFLKAEQRGQGIEIVESYDLFHTPIQVTVRVYDQKKAEIDLCFAEDLKHTNLDLVRELKAVLAHI